MIFLADGARSWSSARGRYVATLEFTMEDGGETRRRFVARDTRRPNELGEPSIVARAYSLEDLADILALRPRFPGPNAP